MNVWGRSRGFWEGGGEGSAGLRRSFLLKWKTDHAGETVYLLDERAYEPWGDLNGFMLGFGCDIKG